LGASSLSPTLFQSLSKLQLLSLAGNAFSTLPSNLLAGRTNLTDFYLYENNLSTMISLASLSKLSVVSLFDNIFSVSGYNAFLDSFKAVPSSTGALYAAPASYGGCIANASLGISAHNTLSGTK
jgi:hypothetical protein